MIEPSIPVTEAAVGGGTGLLSGPPARPRIPSAICIPNKRTEFRVVASAAVKAGGERATIGKPKSKMRVAATRDRPGRATQDTQVATCGGLLRRPVTAVVDTREFYTDYSVKESTVIPLWLAVTTGHSPAEHRIRKRNRPGSDAGCR